MIEKIITTIVGVVLSTSLGYCLNAIKNYKANIKREKENENIQNEALKTLLQSNLTNTYFVYQELGEIPDYVFKNWSNLFKIYKRLGGNDYIDTLKKKMAKWEIKRTDVLNK